MNTYISILRGINVSGKNLIKMNFLKEMYEDMDFQNVRTYIQSGNVVFKGLEINLQELEKSISEAILKRFALNVPVLVCESSALKSILSLNPFLNDSKEDIAKLYITFLSTSPEKPFIERIDSESYLPDKFYIIESTVYLFCPNGYGNTKLNNNFFENKLGVTATTRNLKTLMELVKIADI